MTEYYQQPITILHERRIMYVHPQRTLFQLRYRDPTLAPIARHRHAGRARPLFTLLLSGESLNASASCPWST